MPKKKPGNLNPLKPVCAAGLVLALILSWGLVFLALTRGGSPERKRGNVFDGELAEYDLLDAPELAFQGENPERLLRRLSRLQERAESVEEQLSVLKRRRILALTDRRYIPSYKKAASDAAEIFAFSAPIAAVAADALVFDGGPLSEESAALLRSYAPRLSQSRFGLLELGVRALAGDLEDPALAAAAPGLENLLSPGFSPAPEGGGDADPRAGGLPDGVRRTLLLDEFLLRTVKGDIPGASIRLNTLLSAPESGAAEIAGLSRMAAEFFYDYHNPLRAAELFSRLSRGEAGFSAPVQESGEQPFPAGGAGEKDMARAADALVLAGEIPAARNIWRALSADPSALHIRYRSLYNLAASSADRKEEAYWLENLFSKQAREQRETYESGGTGIFGVIRYTRLLDTARAAAVLEDEDVGRHPLIDLELLRRGLDSLPPLRASAEVWLLLGRGSGEEALYEWAAWYFDHQKLYDETDRLLTEAARKGMTGPWLSLHRGLALVREGKIAEGEGILKEAEKRGEDWRIPANLGRIAESRRAISAALEYYEAAAALVNGGRSAALVQTRISRCLESLGRVREGRRALEYARELDPDNPGIRRELRRFDQSAL